MLHAAARQEDGKGKMQETDKRQTKWRRCPQREGGPGEKLELRKEERDGNRQAHKNPKSDRAAGGPPGAVV